MQQYAGIYLLQNTLHVLGVHRTHHQEYFGLWPRWRKVVAQILRPVPESAVTVLCTPDDGCDGHPKHIE